MPVGLDYSITWLNPLFFSASWYGGAALLKTSASDDMEHSLAFTPLGIALSTCGGWLLSACTYVRLLLSFIYGENLLVFRSRVRSRKLTVFLFTSIFTFRPLFEKTSQIFFFMVSTARGDFAEKASPSSLYSPILGTISFSWLNRYTTTNSHDSAPSNGPIVTSNMLATVFFDHGLHLWKSEFFFDWRMIFFSKSVITWNFSENSNALFSRVSEIGVVELYDVKIDKRALLFVFHIIKPFYHNCGVLS